MFKWLLLFLLASSGTWAQNPTCPTRSLGDATNACASTAFVNQYATGTITGTVTPNLPVIGNATSNGFAQGTRSGNTTLFPVLDSAPVNGQCAQFDGSGGLIPAACPGGGTGSGTVSAATAPQIAYYPTSSTTVAGAGDLTVDATTGGLDITQSASLPVGLKVVQTATGTDGSGIYPTKANSIVVTDSMTPSATGATVAALNSELDVTASAGDPGSVTERDALRGLAQPSAITNINLNVVGVSGRGASAFNMGGTALTNVGAKGVVYGGNFVASSTSSATFLRGLTGIEIDMDAFAAVYTKMGLNVVDGSNNGGTFEDCGVCLGAQTGTPGWSRGLKFTAVNGIFPIAAAGEMIASDVGTTTNGIDLSNVTFTGTGSFIAPGITISPLGRVATYGVATRAGTAGSDGGHTFNINWTGTQAQLYIDTTNAGTITLTSDPRVKHNIQPLDPSLDSIMALRPVSFNWADVGIFRDDHKLHDGFIASEVKAVIPDAVEGETGAVNADGTPSLQSINVLPLVAVLTKSVQELKHQLDTERECRRHFLCRIFGLGA